MTKAVFIESSHSHYQDRPGELYHFPKMYLSRVAKTVGDYVVFYQGRRGGETGYSRVQRVERIVPDPADPNQHFAIMDRGSEWSFDRNVPRVRTDGTPYETGLPLSGGNNTSAVRLISNSDFATILDEGLSEIHQPDTLPRTGPLPSGIAPNVVPQVLQLDDAATPFIHQHDQDRTMVLSSRALRDRAFARQVKVAYAGRCAMSGLELRNGGGRPEVEAAHIIPVEQRGPDTVRNGIALSGTVHWMFDRGLISVDENYDLLIAKNSVAAEVADRLLVEDRKLIMPANADLAPHQTYLHWHRHNCYQG